MNTGRPGLFLLLALMFSCAGPVLGQNKYTFSQFGHETGTFFTQPLHWESSDWLKLGLIGSGTFLSMQADQPVRTAVLRDRRYYSSVPIEGGRIWGEIYMPFAFFSGFALHSLIADDMGTRKIAYEIGQASLYAAAITYTTKFIFGRARPYTGEGAFTYHPFGTATNDDHLSLYSGHATIAFVLSTVLSRNARSGLLKTVAYLPAACTVISRVYQDKHWVSDNLLGAAIGYVVATWVVDHHAEEDSRLGIAKVYPFTVRLILN